MVKAGIISLSMIPSYITRVLAIAKHQYRDNCARSLVSALLASRFSSAGERPPAGSIACLSRSPPSRFKTQIRVAAE